MADSVIEQAKTIIKVQCEGMAVNVARALLTVTERVEQLQREVEQCHAKSTCCCGDYVKQHTQGSGHSPVSMYDYDLYMSQERVEKAEKAATDAVIALEQVMAREAVLREALRPLGAHADILEMGFSQEELTAMGHEHHLVASGISVADCFRARTALSTASPAADALIKIVEVARRVQVYSRPALRAAIVAYDTARGK